MFNDCRSTTSEVQEEQSLERRFEINLNLAKKTLKKKQNDERLLKDTTMNQTPKAKAPATTELDSPLTTILTNITRSLDRAHSLLTPSKKNTPTNSTPSVVQLTACASKPPIVQLTTSKPPPTTTTTTTSPNDLQIQMLTKTVETFQLENERLRNELSNKATTETRTMTRKNSMSGIVIDNIEKMLTLERANGTVLVAVGAIIFLIAFKMFFTYEEANYGVH